MLPNMNLLFRLLVSIASLHCINSFHVKVYSRISNKNIVMSSLSDISSLWSSNAIGNALWLADETVSESVSVYSKVDKTGFIGFIADYVERVIDFGHDTFQGFGLVNSYGYSIILFTLFGKRLFCI